KGRERRVEWEPARESLVWKASQTQASPSQLSRWKLAKDYDPVSYLVGPPSGKERTSRLLELVRHRRVDCGTADTYVFTGLNRSRGRAVHPAARRRNQGCQAGRRRAGQTFCELLDRILRKSECASPIVLKTVLILYDLLASEWQLKVPSTRG